MNTVRSSNVKADRKKRKRNFMSNRDDLRMQYEKAVATRKLEIELFWKRNIYFTAILVGFYAAIQNMGKDEKFVSVLFCLTAFFVSLAWTIANRGSKYWQEVWEEKTEEIERALGIELFIGGRQRQQKHWLYNSRTMSVSRLATFVSDIIVVMWLVLLVRAVINLYCAIQYAENPKVALILILGIVYIAFIGMYLFSAQSMIGIPNNNNIIEN